MDLALQRVFLAVHVNIFSQLLGCCLFADAVVSLSLALAQDTARGLQAWRATLDRGLLPDEVALQQAIDLGQDETLRGYTPADLKWPADPLHAMLLRVLGKLGVAHFARKYPAVKEALLKSLLEVSVKYHRTLLGEKVGLIQEENKSDCRRPLQRAQG
jgi:hypothetical protein